MALFRSNARKILQEFKSKSEHYSNDLSKEIKESYDDLKSDYDEHAEVIPEFIAFISELKGKLDHQEVEKLEVFSSKITKINRCARNGIEAMRDLSRNQRKLTTETLRQYEEFEF